MLKTILICLCLLLLHSCVSLILKPNPNYGSYFSKSITTISSSYRRQPTSLFILQNLYSSTNLNDAEENQNKIWYQYTSKFLSTTVGFVLILNLLLLTTPSSSSSLNLHHQHHEVSIIQSACAAESQSLFNPPSPSYSKSNPVVAITPPAVIDILKDRIFQLRSGVTGEKVGQLRVGESLFERLRNIDNELDTLQIDIFRDNVDWEVVEVYPKIFRAFSPLFTAYTDRAFPTNDPVDKALRYALRYEVGNFYTGVKDLEDGIARKNQKSTQRAFARMSLSYDRYLKAGDLFVDYDQDIKENTGSGVGGSGVSSGGISSSGDSASSNSNSNNIDKKNNRATATTDSTSYEIDDYSSSRSSNKLNYVAPSIDAPQLQDDIVLLKGPDKGRQGTVLWISKGDNIETANVVIKFIKGETSRHSEVKLYPYSLIAKIEPPAEQFEDNLVAAYLASALSSGIMYPIDSYKTRQQTGLKGIPDKKNGGFFGLWKGVVYFIADANDAVYVASYGFLRPALLSPFNLDNALTVFWVSVLAGSVGDAIGSVFRVPMEIIYKQIQTGAADNGAVVVTSLVKNKGSVRLVVLSWVAVLCRDMPFAGLQIALYDVFKNLLSFLDDYGVNVYLQGALWGALAGSVASFLTTPFDVLTTTVMTAAQDESGPLGGVAVSGEDEISGSKVNGNNSGKTDSGGNSRSGSKVTLDEVDSSSGSSGKRKSENSKIINKGSTYNNIPLVLAASNNQAVNTNRITNNNSMLSSNNALSSNTQNSNNNSNSINKVSNNINNNNAFRMNLGKGIDQTTISDSELASLSQVLLLTENDNNINQSIDNFTNTNTNNNNKQQLQKRQQQKSSPPQSSSEFLSALSEVGPIFSQTITDTFVTGGGIGALFNGAIERMLFFGPAAMIFFASYDVFYDVITLAKSGHAFSQN